MSWFAIVATAMLAGCLFSPNNAPSPKLEYLGISTGRPTSAFDFGNTKYRSKEMFVYRVDPGSFFPVSGDRHHFSAVVSLCGRNDLVSQEVPIFADSRPMRSYAGQNGPQEIKIYIDMAMHTYSAFDEDLARPILFSEVALGRDVCVSLKWRERVSEPAIIRPW